MRYLAIEIPATSETWSCHPCKGVNQSTDIYNAALAAADVLVAGDCDCWRAYVVPGDHADAGAASAAWVAWRENEDPKPIARGVYRYDEDGAAPVSLGVEMMEVGR